MPLTNQEYEQLESVLDAYTSVDAISEAGAEKLKKILSKYVSEPAPEPLPTKTAAEYMGMKYSGSGCFVCHGSPSPNPCRQCGWDKELKAFAPKKSGKVPQPGEAGRKEWLEEQTATKLVEVQEADGASTWLNVSAESLDPARGRPILNGRVYNYVGGKLVENVDETAKLQ